MKYHQETGRRTPPSSGYREPARLGMAGLLVRGAGVGIVALGLQGCATPQEQPSLQDPLRGHLAGADPACIERPSGEKLDADGLVLQKFIADRLQVHTSDCLLNVISRIPDAPQKLSSLYGASSPFLARDLVHNADHLLEILRSDELLRTALDLHRRIPQLPFSAGEVYLLQVTLNDPSRAHALADTIGRASELHITAENAPTLVASLAQYLRMRSALGQSDKSEARQQESQMDALITRKDELGLLYTDPRPGYRPEILFATAQEYAASLERHAMTEMATLLKARGYGMHDIIGKRGSPYSSLEFIRERLGGMPLTDVIDSFTRIRQHAPVSLYIASGLISNPDVLEAFLQDKASQAADTGSSVSTQSISDADLLINIGQGSTVEHYRSLMGSWKAAPGPGSGIISSFKPIIHTEASVRAAEAPGLQGMQLALLRHPSIRYVEQGISSASLVKDMDDTRAGTLLRLLDGIARVDPRVTIGYQEIFSAHLDRSKEIDPRRLNDLAAIIGAGGNPPPRLWSAIVQGRLFGQRAEDREDAFPAQMAPAPGSPEARSIAMTDRQRIEASFTADARKNYLRLVSHIDLSILSSIDPLMLLAADPGSKVMFTDAFITSMEKMVQAAGEKRARFSDLGLYLFLHGKPQLQKALFGLGRTGLESRVRTEQATRRHLDRVASNAAAYHLLDQDLAALSFVDLIRVELLYRALEHTATKKELLAGMQKDLEDTRTEYGGLLSFTPSGGLSVTYDESLSDMDGAFRWTPEMSTKLARNSGPFFHFHAVADMGSESGRTGDMAYFAGPSGYTESSLAFTSGGDMSVAQQQSLFSIVFTYLGPTRFNADVYLPGNKVLDLGQFSSDASQR